MSERKWQRIHESLNHVDGNTTNNKASNLEWCTPKENAQHAVRLGLRRQRAVMQIFDAGSTREFSSLVEAQRVTGIKAQIYGRFVTACWGISLGICE